MRAVRNRCGVGGRRLWLGSGDGQQSPVVRVAREFYSTDAATLAERLLGHTLFRVSADGTRLSGTIVETEAYVGVADRASHAFGGRRTSRNASMYARPGTLYVYFTYGMHHCANVVCGAVDEPVAVLIRAIEPLEGVESMRRLRGAAPEGGGMNKDSRMIEAWALCRGPGNLCRALGIDRGVDGADLVEGGEVGVEVGSGVPMNSHRVLRGPRIGIGSAGEWIDAPLRFWIAGRRSVSKNANRPAGGERSV